MLFVESLREVFGMGIALAQEQGWFTGDGGFCAPAAGVNRRSHTTNYRSNIGATGLLSTLDDDDANDGCCHSPHSCGPDTICR